MTVALSRQATVGSGARWSACCFLGLLSAVAVHDAAAAARVPGIPRVANGEPDLTGIWQAISTADFDLEPHSTRSDAPPGAGVIEGDAIPYLPAALKQKQANFAARDKLDPRLQCFTLGVPRDNYYPEPFQILQRPRDLTLIYEFGNSVRTIHTNGTLHPAGDNPEFWLGDSRGHWEGDTLVVDVTDFTDKTWLDRAGDFHSDALHVTERWTPLDRDHLEYKATLEDPKVFAHPWTLSVILYRLKDKNVQLIENYCFTLGYDKYYPVPNPGQASGASNDKQ
jgi:hypothetical protein